MNPPDRKGNRIEKATIKRAEGLPGSSPGRASKGNGVKNVTDLKIAVENGSYRVEASRVADKIVTDAVREIRNRTR